MNSTFSFLMYFSGISHFTSVMFSELENEAIWNRTPPTFLFLPPNSGQMDANGLRPVLNYLLKLHLPIYPSILKKEIEGKESTEKFDWVQTVAAIKRIFGADVIIGFDIFPDPTNRSSNRIVLGTPETESVLPLYVIISPRC